MSGFLLYVAPDGGLCGGVSGLEGHDFLAQLAKIPHVPPDDADIAWPNGERWELQHMAQDTTHDPLNLRAST